jgi:hypothetical protein
MAEFLRRKTSGAASNPCGAAGNGLATTVKYLRCAAGIGLGTTIKYLRCTTRHGLGTMIKCLRDARRAAPRAAAWAPRLSTCDAQRAAPRATA